MTADELRALQAPLKQQYRDDRTSAVRRLRAEAVLEIEDVSCRVETAAGTLRAGLHPAAGGDGSRACSAEMLLEALASCASVTLAAVATALNIPVRGGRVAAHGELDFRGTLGVDRAAAVGFQTIRLDFDLETDAEPEQLAKLIELTERYCVVLRTLSGGAAIETACRRTAGRRQG